MQINFYPSIAFGAMKKSQFKSLDLACVETFKAPIQQFNTHADLNAWAATKLLPKFELEQYHNKNYDETKERLERLQCWTEYLGRKDNFYDEHPAQALFIFNSITKDIKPNNREMPPIFDAAVLAKTVENFDINSNFKKAYENNLRIYNMSLGDEVDTGETETKWVRIPSKYNDRENFEANVVKLKMLSHRSWCTKSSQAGPYLEKGDFHIYLKNGQPKAGIRLIFNRIAEIQGEKNNSVVPFRYVDKIDEYIKEHKFNTDNVRWGIEQAKEQREDFDKLNSEIAELIKNNDYDAVLKIAEIEVTYEDGKRVLSNYGQPLNDCNWQELGVNENKLLKDVVKIKGWARFEDSTATDLSKLEYIGGDVYFNKRSHITDLSNLKYIRGNAEFEKSKVNDLSSLEYIGGNANFKGTDVTDLGNLRRVDGNAYFSHAKVTNLSRLEYVGEDGFFRDTGVTDLSRLKYIFGNAKFEDSKVTDLSSLGCISGFANFEKCPVKSVPSLTAIGKDLYLSSEEQREIFKNVKVEREIIVRQTTSSE